MRRPGGAWVALVLVTAVTAGAGTPLPWETWTDLRHVAVVPEGDQVALRSSHCLSGCRFDRHSKGDERFIRLDGDEGVIFEERGPGAVVRIWMTTGDAGVSLPLDPATSIRFYIDGEATPRVDLPLPELFDGSALPFVPPLVGDRKVSSGGNFSYVPIPYARSCRIVLAGDLTQRLWFQFTFHRLSEAAVVESFTGLEDLSGLTSLLSRVRADPWPAGSGTTVGGTRELLLQEPQVLWSRSGPGTITELSFELPPADWERVQATLVFDGQTTVDLRLSDLFAAGTAESIKSLWLRSSAIGELNSFWPMPFWESAALVLTLDQGADPLTVGFRLRLDEGEPIAGSGLFGALLSVSDPLPLGSDHALLARDGPGKWVGLYAELSSFGTPARQYLEGDEHLFVDGLRHPTLYGTGVEDFFNGGFYFDQGLFDQPLHGLLEQGLTRDNEHASVAYRFLLTDAVPFASSLVAGLEGGPEADLRLRARTVAYHYVDTRPPLVVTDVLDVGDPTSRLDHEYQTQGPEETRTLDALFEGEPPEALVADGNYREAGVASFLMASGRECSSDWRIRRLWDAGVGGQSFRLVSAGIEVGGSNYTLANTHRRWSELDFDLPPPAGQAMMFEVDALPQDTSGEFTGFRYELLCRPLPTPIFGDGFETGDTTRWSQTVGSP